MARTVPLQLLCSGPVPVLVFLLLYTTSLTANAKKFHHNSITEVGVSGENRLHNRLSRINYSPAVRPVLASNVTIPVNIAIAPTRIVHVDEEHDTVELAVWVRQRWHDEILTWDVDQYGGIERIHLTSHKVWRPSIVIQGSEHHTDLGHKDSNVHIAYDGMVTWSFPAKVKAVCHMDLTHFPFDRKHKCTLRFISYLYTNEEVSLDFFNEKHTSLDFSTYHSHKKWRLSGGCGKKSHFKDKWSGEKYDSIDYDFRLVRRSISQDLGLFLAPVALIALLTPALFLLPPANKINMGVGLLVSMTILFSLLSEHLPTSQGHIPVLEQYYVGVFILLVIALIMVTVTTNMAEGSPLSHEPPNLLRKIMRSLLSCIGWLTCLRRLSPYTPSTMGLSTSMSGDAHTLDATTAASYSSLTSMDKSEHDEVIARGSHQRSGSRHIEWRIMATVLDRFCFVLFFLATLLLPLVLSIMMYCNA